MPVGGASVKKSVSVTLMKESAERKQDLGKTFLPVLISRGEGFS